MVGRFLYRCLRNVSPKFLGAVAVIALGLAGVAQATVTVSLSPSVPSPELLGTHVTWTATIQNGVQGHTYDYQFSVALAGQNQIVRDFDLPNTFLWAPWTVEGTYTVTVVARDITAQPIIVYAPVHAQYQLNPIVTAPGQSAVNLTSHPLVALFSAGPCTAGHSIRVRFHQNGVQTSSTTNAVPCSSSSANFLVAGMMPATQYEMQWEEFANNYLNDGPSLAFTTGHLPNNFPPAETFQVNIPATGHDAAFPIVTFHLIPTIGELFTFWPTTTDLSGNILWYNPGQAYMTRAEIGGNYFTCSYSTLSEHDLTGAVTLQTNVEILNEQLAAKGYPDDERTQQP